MESSRRPQLPPMGYFDHDKARRDEDAYHDRLAAAPQAPSAPLPAASPAHQYPSGPPPPYSHPAPPSQYLPNTTPSTPATMHTPPESRRTSENEKDAIKQTVRQSLPSISEALGVESQPIYRSSLPMQTTPSSTQPPPLIHGLASSPSPRSHRIESAQQPSEQHGAPPSHYTQYRPEPPRHSSYPSVDAPKPTFADSRPPVHMPASRSPPPQRSAHNPGQYAPTTAPRSPAHEQPPQHPAGSMGPPNFPYGYQPYPQRFATPAQPPTANPGPVYQPSLSNAAPSTASTSWKSENARYGGEERTYGDSVKRQLEMYDLAGALTDISSTSGIMTDFARRYGDRLHQTSRSGPTPSTLPGLVEVEDMINKARLQVDCLSKIREVVVAQQVAYDQQAAEQRQQQKAYAEPIMSAMQHEDDMKNGFAGSDPKKRRGRAAPPGRCHSCNRAETPEWRRGPDGARTLCNACGLHYAKLTRKEKNASKNAAVNNSNLRPKESMS